MTMRTDLRALLTSAPLVAELAPGGIDWMTSLAPTESAFVTLQQISATAEMTQDGAAFASARVQIDCYAPTLSGAATLAEAVMARLAGYQGGSFDGIFPAGLRDGRTDLDSGASLYRVSLDFIVHHHED